MAWGYLRLDGNRAEHASTQEVLVAAIRRDVFEDYVALFDPCGIQPSFTLAGLARSQLCTFAGRPLDLFDMGEDQLELLRCDALGPLALRVFPGTLPDPQSLLTDLATTAHLRGENATAAVSRRCVLTGVRALDPVFAGSFVRGLGDRSECVNLESPANGAPPAAIRGLQHAMETGREAALLVLELREAEKPSVLAHPAPWKWGALASAIVIAMLLLPMLEALLFRPALAERLAHLRVEQTRLGVIDREFEFLRYLRQNQPPYLDALLVLAAAIPPGSKLDGLTMSRRGELSFRGMLPNAQQVVDFRSRLVDSGFFSSVVVAEQTPGPDRQRVNVRIDAQWKPAEARSGQGIMADETPEKGRPPQP
jgi:hypothetical protein